MCCLLLKFPENLCLPGNHYDRQKIKENHESSTSWDTRPLSVDWTCKHGGIVSPLVTLLYISLCHSQLERDSSAML